MKIRLVTQWYPPEPAGVPAGLAHGLASRGHSVDVLTGFPNYPTGRLHPGYPLRPYRHDVDDTGPGQIDVHRAPLYPSHDTNAFSRLANYGSFALSSTVVSATRLARADVWLTYSSPATATLPALVSGGIDSLRKRLGMATEPSAHAQIIQDLWPDSVMDSGFVGHPQLAQLMQDSLDRFCRYGYRHSDAIGVISPGMRTVLRQRGVPDELIVDTPNWVSTPRGAFLPEEQKRAERARLRLPLAGRLFMYAGNLGELQALPLLIDGFAAVPDAQLVLLGPGVMTERIAARIAAQRLSNVTLVPAQPPEKVADYLSAADVLVVSLADTPLLRVTMPSKVAGSLAAARPLLGHACGDSAEVIAAAGAGLVAAPGDAVALVAAIREMTSWSEEELHRRGESARSWYEENLGENRCIDGHEKLVELALQNAQNRRKTNRSNYP
ncbi:glycosyltransferase family 4 protein [Gephyromycinifex aptenodytis]|uniref:glycosyltransferase family 4 protein n=1 Tax=Gephyromycinifex aptenodytis TaxID=2716227 RepID=UPI0014482A06|nr:glycosyltransferase family 4 protein [Gephyromycinifex aptenodytis]